MRHGKRSTRVADDVVIAQWSDGAQHIDLAVAQVAGVETDRRLHRHQAQQLQQMVLQHVLECADAVVVPGPAFQRERLVAGLHAVAGCERAMADTVAYVRQRHAFGGPLSEKQVIRHKLADLATLIEAGRWLTYATCLTFKDGGDPDYDGLSGPLTFAGNGEPLQASYGQLTLGANNRVVPSLTTYIDVQGPADLDVAQVPVEGTRESVARLTISQ